MIFERDNWQEIFATIRKNKLRTFLTMLGVFWGIFMLVVMLGAGNGLRNGIMQDFGGTATNSFYIWTQTTTKSYKGMKPGRNFNYNLDDYKALLQIPELDVSNVIHGLKAVAAQIQANYPNTTKIAQAKIAEGRFLNDNDIKESRKICVIGPRIAETLYKKDEKIIGSYIRINGVYFKVVGLTAIGASGDEGRQQAQRISVPFSSFQKAFNFGDIVGWFAIKSKDNISAEISEKKVIAVLKERHKIAPDDLKAIGHFNLEAEYNKLQGLFTGISFLIWVVGIGTLLAGVIGISNIMLIVVKERTKEIGVKRALGAVPLQIIGQIVIESVFLTSIAGYFGLVCGVFILEALDSAIGKSGEMFTNPTVDLNIAVVALTVLIVSGALAGLIPASKAIAIKPVEALRTE
jgi:putative ABC transport system permease protein